MVGGGVVGVATAYHLAREGMDVVVYERGSEVAPETSRTNGGLIAPGHSFAWASPAAPGLLLRSLLGRDASIRLRLPPDPRLIPWGLRFLGQCTDRRSRANSLAKLALARYSQLALEALLEETGIDCGYRSGGVLYLYRSEGEFAAGKRKMALMREHGQRMRELDPAQIAEADPALAPAAGVYAGALLGLTDTTADSLPFTRALAERSTALGAEFRFGRRVHGIRVSGGRAVGVRTDAAAEDDDADLVVLAAGAYSRKIRVPGARRPPVYPARGFAMDVPLLDPERAPALGGLDERNLVAWAPADGFLRMAAVAQFAGFDRRIDASAKALLADTGAELFGDALDWERAEIRVGFRAMTPDGPPVIGPSRVAGLYYNTGHGHMGWTMACGSARILRDLVLGREPEIDASALLPGRRSW